MSHNLEPTMEPIFNPPSVGVQPLPSSLHWSATEEKKLIQLMEQNQQRVHGGEISMANLFDEVSMELNLLKIGLQKTSAACKEHWYHLCNSRPELFFNAWNIDVRTDVKDDGADEDELEDGNASDTSATNPRSRESRIPWSSEEKSIFHDVVKKLRDLEGGDGSKILKISQISRLVSKNLEKRGYSRSDKSCRTWWERNREIFEDDETAIDGSEKTSPHHANINSSSFKTNHSDANPLGLATVPALLRGNEEMEKSSETSSFPPFYLAADRPDSNNGRFTELKRDALERLFEHSTYPSKEEIKMFAKQHGLTFIQVSRWFSNRRFYLKKGLAMISSEQERLTRKRFRAAVSEQEGIDNSDDAQEDTIAVSKKLKFVDSSARRIPGFAAEEDRLGDFSPLSPPRKSARSEIPSEDRGSMANLFEINYPVHAAEIMEASSIKDDCTSAEIKRGLLDQCNALKEQIAALGEEKKILKVQHLTHQTRAAKELEAALASQEATIQLQRQIDEAEIKESGLNSTLDDHLMKLLEHGDF